MALINGRGPAEPLIKNTFINSPSMGPCILAKNTQDGTCVIYSLDPGPPPPPWEPLPKIEKGKVVMTAEQVRQMVEDLLKGLDRAHAIPVDTSRR